MANLMTRQEALTMLILSVPMLILLLLLLLLPMLFLFYVRTKLNTRWEIHGFHRHRVMHPPPTCLPPTCHRRRHIQRFHLPSSSSLVVHAVRSLLTYLQAASLLIYLLTCVLA